MNLGEVFAIGLLDDYQVVLTAGFTKTTSRSLQLEELTAGFTNGSSVEN